MALSYFASGRFNSMHRHLVKTVAVVCPSFSFSRVRNRLYHREPLTKALEDGLFELHHVGKLNTRVLWFFIKGRRIVAVHGIRNKGQAVAARDLATARERMRDWKERKL